MFNVFDSLFFFFVSEELFFISSLNIISRYLLDFVYILSLIFESFLYYVLLDKFFSISCTNYDVKWLEALRVILAWTGRSVIILFPTSFLWCCWLCSRVHVYLWYFLAYERTKSTLLYSIALVPFICYSLRSKIIDTFLKGQVLRIFLSFQTYQ